MNVVRRNVKRLRAKRVFLKKGTCSRTFAFILNREFGNPRDAEERALDPLAGGILQHGYQCGMLWGSSLGVGAEAFRKFKDISTATAYAIIATQSLMDAFSNKTGHIDCFDITNTDWHKKWSIAKFFMSGKVISCYTLTGKWAPEAIEAAYEGLEDNDKKIPTHCKSCASELIRKMGGTEEDAGMVAGWAGGMGLSGNACGALAAAIWYRTLQLCRQQPGKSFYYNANASEILETFYKETNYEILCKDITGKTFSSIEEHTDFMDKGGCKQLLEVLAKS